jgi:hypothetical protein
VKEEEEERKREEEGRGSGASWWASHVEWTSMTESRHVRQCDSGHVVGTVPRWSLIAPVHMVRLLRESCQPNWHD